jgi:hypothetical protein
MVGGISSKEHYSKGQQIAIVAGALLFIGTVVFQAIDQHSFLDGLYLTVATLTTVGFGDMVPEHTASRVFTCTLQLCGLAIFTQFMDSFGDWTDLVMSDFTLTSRLGVATAIFLITQIFGTLIFMWTEGLSFGNAIYFTFTVATSVGYGDIAPTTDYGKFGFVIFSLLTLAPFGFVVEVIGETIMDGLFPSSDDNASVEKRPPIEENHSSGSREGGSSNSRDLIGVGERAATETPTPTPTGWAVCWGLGWNQPQNSASRRKAD